VPASVQLLIADTLQKTKRHRNEIEHRAVSKSRFPMDGGGFIKGL